MNDIRKRRNPVGIITALAAFFLLAVIVFLRFESSAGSEAETLRLWYVEDDYFTGLLKLADKSGVRAGNNGTLNIRCFKTEDELAAALDEETPEMLYCAGDTAEALSLNGSLKSIGTGIDGLSAGFGRLSGNAAFESGQYFPLKLEAEVFVYSEAAINGGCTFDRLVSFPYDAQDAESPKILACSSYYELFNALSGGSTCALGGDRLENAANEDFVSVYNQLAETAMNGGLYSGELDPLDAVINGECLCCSLLSSSFDPSALPEGIAVSVPDCGGSILAGSFGIAVTAEDDAAAAGCAGFIASLVKLASSPEGFFPVGPDCGAAANGSESFVLKGYTPGAAASTRKFDKEISRTLSILCS